MLKPKQAMAAILSTIAIASGVLLGSADAQPCALQASVSEQEHYEQANWLRSPFAIAIALPGVAIATALSLGYHYYKGESR